MLNEVSIKTRSLIKGEKALIRRTHLSFIPFVLITLFIVGVIYLADSLPLVYRIAGCIIALGALLIFSKKQITLENELKKGEVVVVRGVVTNKYKFGGNRKIGGGGISRSRSSNGMPTYIIVIGDKKYWVRSKTYKKATKGAFSEMVWLPDSKYVISIEIAVE